MWGFSLQSSLQLLYLDSLSQVAWEIEASGETQNFCMYNHPSVPVTFSFFHACWACGVADDLSVNTEASASSMDAIALLPVSTSEKRQQRCFLPRGQWKGRVEEDLGMNDALRSGRSGVWKFFFGTRDLWACCLLLLLCAACGWRARRDSHPS